MNRAFARTPGHPVDSDLWQRAVWCLVLHGRVIQGQEGAAERTTRLMGAVDAMRSASLSERRAAIASLRRMAAQEGGLVETALIVAEDAAA